MYNEVTVLFVSFHSDDIIEKSIITIDKNIKIIVVENSINNDLKSKLEKKYPNVSVVLPEKNLGNGAGINFGLKKINTNKNYWKTTSDTEVVLECIVKFGFPKAVEMLNGMFAIAAYCFQSKAVWLARDKFGEKPIYYSFDQKNGFFFSSEIKFCTTITFGHLYISSFCEIIRFKCDKWSMGNIIKVNRCTII